MIKLCDVSAVEPDVPARAERDGQAYAIYVVDGTYYVTQDLCTHGRAKLSDGYVEGHEVECPFHQGRFDVRTGLATAAPCVEPLRVWTAIVQDGAVLIDPAQGRVGEG